MQMQVTSYEKRDCGICFHSILNLSCNAGSKKRSKGSKIASIPRNNYQKLIFCTSNLFETGNLMVVSISSISKYLRGFSESKENQKGPKCCIYILRAPKAKSGYKQVISDGKLDGGIYSC